MSRLLRKISEVEELSNMNMQKDILDQVVYNKGDDATNEKVVFRRLMNENTRLVVEIWKMSNNYFAVYSGQFSGMWTIDNVIYYGMYGSESEAELFVQSNLQGSAEVKKIIEVNSSKKSRLKKIANNNSDFSHVIFDFLRDYDIPAVDTVSKKSLNKYFKTWESYVNKYYPSLVTNKDSIVEGWHQLTNYLEHEGDDVQRDEKDSQEESHHIEEDSQEKPFSTPGIDVQYDSDVMLPSENSESQHNEK